jgi:hypothetical protein
VEKMNDKSTFKNKYHHHGWKCIGARQHIPHHLLHTQGCENITIYGTDGYSMFRMAQVDLHCFHFRNFQLFAFRTPFVRSALWFLLFPTRMEILFLKSNNISFPRQSSVDVGNIPVEIRHDGRRFGT